MFSPKLLLFRVFSQVWKPAGIRWPASCPWHSIALGISESAVRRIEPYDGRMRPPSYSDTLIVRLTASSHCTNARNWVPPKEIPTLKYAHKYDPQVPRLKSSESAIELRSPRISQTRWNPGRRSPRQTLDFRTFRWAVHVFVKQKHLLCQTWIQSVGSSEYRCRLMSQRIPNGYEQRLDQGRTTSKNEQRLHLSPWSIGPILP